ncbi:GTP 3',8-cyclase MoaA [Paenibacillus sp.]|jgi:cyclic pyranopterin phosphate synthase|uniref:GTP 3',8-cyclase MoaA n=1 Tax=Paenibacillus sp. TaxID=58172 RepID=UPI00281BBCBA|nr:GTP 3',8-cyclase MoaA [Paenibacillus sp.]MDR0268236.1 GTP 3',8-cyclase MoaA [Paenibacillus sp.]
METKDYYKRVLRDLRVSVTDRCNFRCRYCMPEEIFNQDYPFLTRDHILSVDETVRLARIFARLGVQKMRITGGEPTLRRELPEIIAGIAGIPGVNDIALTTNGSLLTKQAAKLREAGLMRVAVSLDALDDETFFRMNGGKASVRQVLEGIDAAAEAGLKIKVNMVVQKGVNEHALLPMVRYFRERGHILRMIEYMDVGNTNGWDWKQVVSKKEMLERIGAEFPLEPAEPNYTGEVASRFRFLDGKGEIGIISSVSDAFCSSCTRGRISADGIFYTCLFATQGHDLRALLRSDDSDDEITERIVSIWEGRHDQYSLEREVSREKRSGGDKVEMSRIGG